MTSPYGRYGAGQISRDGKIAFATVEVDAQAQDLPSAAINAVIHTTQAVQGPNLKVELNGQAIENVQPQKSSSTTIGVILALLVLGLAFGALFAAITPILTALVAIGIGYALTGLLSHVLAIVSFAPILGVLIGLGVGVDYALFIVTRHRSGVRAGKRSEGAAVNAVDTAGRAVFFAGLTVAIALLGQFALGLSILYGVAVAATVTVALTMLASLTLLPALLGFIGPRVLSRRARAAGSATWGPELRDARVRQVVSVVALDRAVGFLPRSPVSWSGGGRDRRAPGVQPPARPRRRWHRPVFLDDPAGLRPAGHTGFGPGFNGPFELVVSGPRDQAARPHSPRVVEAAARQPGIVAATPPQASPRGGAAVALLYPAQRPTSRLRPPSCSTSSATK